MGVPLTRIDAKTNKVARQWLGKGRGFPALRFRINLAYGLQEGLADTDCDSRTAALTGGSKPHTAAKAETTG
jgi:hypothetical protein